MQDRLVIFGSTVGFWGTPYLMAPFKITPGWPLLPWQRNLRQKGYNSACIGAIPEIFASNRWFPGLGYWMMPDKFYCDQPLLPWQQNLGQNRL